MTSRTPMFPGWNALAGRAAKSRLTRMEEERRALCARGLPGMQALLAGLVDPQLFAATAAGPGSRWRVFDTATTFHVFLWQTLDGQSSCREAVQQVQLARAGVKGAALPGSSTSAYCQARSRLDTGAGAIKRRPSPYPLLTTHRHDMKPSPIRKNTAAQTPP